MSTTNPDIIIDIPADIENAVVPTVPRSRPSPDATTPGYLSLQFLVQRPRDAIAQFRKHIETFEVNQRTTIITCCDIHLEIERVAWISQQYQTFADLFRQAISSGLKASKTQHPGFYYYEAAIQLIKKRQLELQLTCHVPQTNSITPLMKEMINSYNSNPNLSNVPLAQTTSWPMQHHTQFTDPLGISKQQYDQSHNQMSYSEAIILLLHTAIEYFKEWNCHRMEHFLSVMIADEYIQSGEHHKAISIYSSALAMYKSERWLTLSKSISQKLEKVIEQPLDTNTDERGRFDRMTRYEAHRCLDFRLPSVVSSLERLSLKQNEELKSSILDLKVDALSQVNCRQPFEMRLSVNNLIDEELGLQISIGKSECFMFCGSKMIHANIAAKGNHVQNYILYPLLCGCLALPRLFLTVQPRTSTPAESINLDHILDKLIGNIQIMPRVVYSSTQQEGDKLAT